MSKNLEQLSRNLAGGMSRRGAFKTFAAGLGGVVLALVGGGRANAQGNSVCVERCRARYSGRDFGQCVSASAQCPPGMCATRRHHDEDLWVCTRSGYSSRGGR